MAAAAAAAVKRRQEVEAAIAAGNIDPLTPQPPKKRRTSLPDVGEGLWRYQRRVAIAYMDVKAQLAVAMLISGNFLVNIVEKWVDPSGEKHADLWRGTDLFFNILFFIELLINMYGFWWIRFWTSAWNVFDFVVVSIGMMDVFQVPLPGPLSLLRMMRAFRVFRLFKRVKSLKKILDSLTKALPAHVNSFGILCLVMCIYAILAVDFYMSYGAEGFYVSNLNQTIELITARGLTWGEEYYGNFGLSLFTMFQVLTGDSWSEVVARPLVHGYDGFLAFGSTLYFISFQLVCGIVLVNVTIAVLLEKMVDDGSEKMEEAQLEAHRIKEAAALSGESLDFRTPSAAKIQDEREVLKMEVEVKELRKDLLVLHQGLKDVLYCLQPQASNELEVASVTSTREQDE